MRRDLISNRIILGTLIFVTVIVVSALLYHQHVRRISDEELAQLVTPQPREHKDETRPAAGPIDISSVDFENAETPFETENTPPIDEESVVFTEDDLFIANDMLDMFIEATDGIDEIEEAPYGVSPFGFGPLPEIPPDYPDQDIWEDFHISTGMEPYSELVIRTRIALWKQGIRTVGALRDNTYNLIYPIIDDVVYIKWADNLGPDGEPYVERVLTSPVTDDSYDLHTGIFPPHLTIYEFPDGGIDPYDFLGLPR